MEKVCLLLDILYLDMLHCIVVFKHLKMKDNNDFFFYNMILVVLLFEMQQSLCLSFMHTQKQVYCVFAVLHTFYSVSNYYLIVEF